MLRGVNTSINFTHSTSLKDFVPNAVVTKSGQVPVNTAKQSSPRATTSISTVRPVNTAAPKPKVNDALPITCSYFKAHSPVKRAFNQISAAKTNRNGYLRKGRKTKPKRQNRTRNGKAWKRQSQDKAQV
ncbi:hypothetical protein Tco_0769105 [Tanacetum coccineum]|uniref:Uncharacterized protein n=1 Tax=Tanacetum coccineum TaxID=301880 RepID=A0ABQ4Z8H1_9ASTR